MAEGDEAVDRPGRRSACCGAARTQHHRPLGHRVNGPATRGSPVLPSPPDRMARAGRSGEHGRRGGTRRSVALIANEGLASAVRCALTCWNAGIRKHCRAEYLGLRCMPANRKERFTMAITTTPPAGAVHAEEWEVGPDKRCTPVLPGPYPWGDRWRASHNLGPGGMRRPRAFTRDHCRVGPKRRRDHAADARELAAVLLATADELDILSDAESTIRS